MLRSRSFAVAAFALTATMLAACSDVTAPASNASQAASFAKSGTSTGGGNTGGGNNSGTVTTDPGTTTTTSTTAGPPVAPTYVARITAIGEIPAGLYYGTPSDWYVGGYLFKSAYLSSFKPVNGPLVVGACVSVSFVESDGVYLMSELKTVASSKCS